MTVDDILEYVRNIQNEANAQTPYWTDKELYSIIWVKCNQILGQIGLIQGTDTSTTTVIGQANYDIPTYFTRVRRLWYDGRPLKYVGFRMYEGRRPTGVAVQGMPREFTIWNNQVILTPTPGDTKVLTFFGEKSQPKITSGDDVLLIPEVFHSAVCDAVLSDMYTKDENAAFAQMYEQRWIQLHIPAMKEYVKRRGRRGMPSVVIDTDSVLETEYGVI